MDNNKKIEKAKDWWYDISDAQTQEILIKEKIKLPIKDRDIVKLFFIYGVSQRSELFSLAEMKQAFEAGEKHKYECYADSKERKCYCRNDDDCTWRKYQTFEDWIKTKENCG